MVSSRFEPLWIVSTLKTINMHLFHPRLRSVAGSITKNCDACQREKLPGPQYGHLPPREAALLPREEVALDLIGS
jgi:hypothetical protein